MDAIGASRFPRTDIPPDSVTAALLFVESLDVGFEMAVSGTCALAGVDREEAIRRVARVFADEDRRRLPALLRMSKGVDHGSG